MLAVIAAACLSRQSHLRLSEPLRRSCPPLQLAASALGQESAQLPCLPQLCAYLQGDANFRFLPCSCRDRACLDKLVAGQVIATRLSAEERLQALVLPSSASSGVSQ